MNLFNLSLFQIIILWIGAIIFTAMAMDFEPFGGYISSFTILLDTAIVIYTISWKRNRKK